MGLWSKTVRIEQLTPADRSRMYEILSKYYEHVTEAQFLSDLSRKNAVILMRDTSKNRIQGFSTILDIRMKVEGRTVIGAFSGDTIVERAYWGQGTLGKAFLAYMLKQKLKNPFKTFYWFLISKGYKTYLLMANNCPTHYPRHEKPTPAHVKAIMDRFYSELYPGNYDAGEGVIAFNGPACHLKTGVAAIERGLADANPRIAYFAEKNPGWHKGNELACIATITFAMPFAYQLKCLVKALRASRALRWTPIGLKSSEVKS
ncbi:MAG TPA: hypothetical protein VFV50_11065 [Bdellovibrionales bacterium]|nr:hypothetical protein [Bdellovibrionales bacterium]